MALKRMAYTRPSAQMRARRRRVGGRGAGDDAQRREPGLEPALVQILVVVANTQVRTLKADVEKGST